MSMGFTVVLTLTSPVAMVSVLAAVVQYDSDQDQQVYSGHDSGYDGCNCDSRSSGCSRCN